MLDGFFKKALGDIKSSYRSKVDKCEALKREREELAVAPATREEHIEYLHAQVDRDASAYTKKLHDSLRSNLDFLRSDSQGPGGEPSRASIFTARRHPEVPPTLADVEMCLCYFFPDEIKKSIASAIQAMEPWPNSQKPRKGREAKLQKLDKEISALEAEIKAMKIEAAESGVML